MLDVERWAELRREHFVRGVSIKELARRTGLARNTIRAALRSDVPPVFRCPERPSKLDPFKDEIHRLLQEDPRLPGVRVRELIEPLGFDGRQDDHRRLRARGAAAVCEGAHASAHGLSAGGDLPVGSVGAVGAGAGRPRPDAHGLGGGRRVWATRAPAPARWCSARRRRTCCGGWRAVCGRWARCRSCWSWDREGCLHAGGGRPTEALPRSAGSWRSAGNSATPATRQAKGAVERLQGYHGDELRAGPLRSPTSSTSSTSSTRWFEERANARMHRTLRERPIDRLDRGARGDAGAARARARTSTGAGGPGAAATRIVRVEPTTTRWTPSWSGGASRCASPSARSSRSRSTPASSPAGTSACSPSTSTITALAHARDARAPPRRNRERRRSSSSSARWSAMTG